VTTFQARVYAQEYLPAGATEVHALVAILAEGGGPGTADGPAPSAAEVIIVDCSGSMGIPLTKIEAARQATAAAIDRLRDGTRFAVVAGTDTAGLVYPDSSSGMAVAAEDSRAAAKARVSDLRAQGGTAISTWLALARRMLSEQDVALRHAILLTDGKNESESAELLQAELERCRGAFICDCRGVGVSWNRAEVEGIAHALLGDADIVPRPSDMPAAFEQIVERAMGRRIESVEVVVQTPGTASVLVFAQCFPQIEELTNRVTWRRLDDDGEWQPAERDNPEEPMEAVYPTGAWSGDEQREYHLCVRVIPQEPDDPYGLRAAVVRLMVDGEPTVELQIVTRWTHDARLATRMHPRLTGYLKLTDVVQDVEEAFRAIDAGERERATRLLLHAHEVALQTGNPETAELLDRLVDVRTRTLRRFTELDRLTTEVRSRRTAIQPSPNDQEDSE
jgi:von Willebrand factor type A domain